MNAAEITVLEEIELENPIFIEALPGLGHVGKLAADHMIDELGATKFAEIYSPTFPPQVLVKDEGVIENMLNELFYVKDVGENNLDLILLVLILNLLYFLLRSCLLIMDDQMLCIGF